ncbi:MAG: PAS domain-containing protein [Desulfarculaceae bacterium]|nr:PAS domain-containing protein [Desulfarculaceae bacterium]
MTDTIQTLEMQVHRLKEENRRIKRKNDLSRALINAMDFPVVMIDGTGTVLNFNRRAADRFNLREEQGETVRIWEKLTASACSQWEKEIVKSIKENDSVKFQYDEGQRLIEVIICPYFDREGRIRYFTVLEKDITENATALENINIFNEQHHLTKEQMVEASKLINLGTLVSGISHEISNPNSFILTNAPLLAKIWSELEAPLTEHLYANDIHSKGFGPSEIKTMVPSLLHGIEEGARRIDRIVKSLKTFSRPEKADGFESVCLNRILKTSLVYLNKEISRSTRHFSTRLEDSLPKIAGVPQRIEQVLVNLILNSCQALTSFDQEIDISTRSDEDLVCFHIQDKGCGIESGHLAHIYEPFFSTKAGDKGTGLGLSITSKIVKEHNGTIDIQSTPGEGTSVTVKFPQMKGEVID